MKAILLMTISANGYIARPDDEAPWSREEFERCGDFVRKAGNIIVGKRTYEIMKEAGDFDESIQTIVLSKTSSEDAGNVHFVASPAEALKVLKTKSFETAIIGGGTTTNTAFLDAGLIDEIIFDIEPLIFGEGLPLFKGQNDIHLELLSSEKLDENSLRLHYKVVK